MGKKSYSGINIQWPISELILSKKKTIETRTYPLPKKFMNQEMVLIETPGRNGNFKARIRAIIKFTDCFKYDDKTSFYADIERHHVSPDSAWSWGMKDKWGWKIELIKVLDIPVAVGKKKGIKFTNDLRL